ncbi:FMN-dependent NADH-azoreductase [Clostridium fungisolvens]|uniref:FMN dependent NADH:quinone oxidoreductase n=1 Tax=Clostridium fungisolvens TaxID=1604897 RepID=A0A6V8SDL2_9CLOT|nr:FMN-dependent NADH-azoreductase [Clostridium fungisolvens]GFP74545.1 FMN-dependent NADH-azoreductase 1 [Clostridium fungisolvens]
MSKVLYIKANCKPDEASRTFKISDSFIEKYKEINPKDEIITLDLYKEDINFLSAEDLGSVFGPKNEESKKHPVLKYAYQFAEADKYVIAEPLWNLSIPAILKAYIDYVSVTGITFRYTEQGPVGMLQGKKAINIVARGGAYSEGPAADFEMGDRYLRTIFGFFGITDFTTVAAEMLDVVGQDVDAIVNGTINKAKDLAKDF